MEGLRMLCTCILLMSTFVLLTEPIDVRIAGSGDISTGRVEIKYNGTWGTVCDYNWNIEASHVVCRMLGYEQAIKRIRLGPGTGPIWLDDVSCKGDESSIEECRHRGWGVTDCDHDDDIGVACRPRASIQFRLVNGTTSHTGILQVHHIKTWGNVIADNFDLRDAHVVCRMIGFSQAVAFFTHYANSTVIFKITMNCNGDEWSVSQCGHIQIQQTLSCLNKSKIGIVCKPSSGTWTSKLRLANRPSAKEGRVEMQRYGVWGTVCNHGWSMREANVVCRMLNYSGAVTASQRYGDGTGPIWITELECKGDEKNITNCTHGGLGQTHMCSHGNDAGVLCHSYSGDVQVRLRGGSSYSGQVQVLFNGQWRAVCGYYWDIEEASVVCRMLNYTRALAAISRYEGGTESFWLNGVRCSGMEKSISLCDHWGWGKRLCTDDDVGVICDAATPQLPNVAFRLAGGSTPNQGRVEVRYYGVWGTVCQNYWTLADAHAVCRMLNYSRASWAGIAKQQGRGSILLTRLGCRGNEKNIDQCNPRWGVWYCYNAKDAGAKCENISSDELSIKVRLIGYGGGEQSHFGRVEVHYNETWIPVCDDTWDISDAHVICRMLGYKAALAGIKRFGSAKTGLWMGNVECSGDEVSISECYHRGWTNTRCPGNYHAGVMCKVTEDPPPVQVRLEGGRPPNSGRVAVRYGNVWGTICNRGLNINDAKVICRMLGYPWASKVYPKSTFRPGNGTIWLSNLECNGTENSIVDCHHPGWGQTTCNHDNDVAIVCKTAEEPRLAVNGSGAVTQSTLTLQVEPSTSTGLNSVIQFIVEKMEEQVILFSLDQNQARLPSKIENKTIAMEMSPSFYVTAEVLDSSLISNFTIGDGKYYHGYYNAPLEPGSLYKVFSRVVTMTVDGKNVYSNASFVLFSTKPDNYRIIAKENERGKGFPEVLVLCFSLGIMVLVIVIIGCFVRFNIRTKNKKHNKRTAENSGIEMITDNIKADESTEYANYQSLIGFQPDQNVDSWCGNTLERDQNCRYQPTSNEKVEINLNKNQEKNRFTRTFSCLFTGK